MVVYGLNGLKEHTRRKLIRWRGTAPSSGEQIKIFRRQKKEKHFFEDVKNLFEFEFEFFIFLIIYSSQQVQPPPSSV